MTYDVVMPQYGLTMTEATLVNWLKKEGESVAKGEPLFTIETDKVTSDIESPRSGKLTQLVVGTGQVAEVGTVLARLELAEGEAVSAEAEAPTAKASRPAVPTSPSRAPSEAKQLSHAPATPRREAAPVAVGAPLVSPRAKGLARELGVDLQAVADHVGRTHLMEVDIRSFAESRATASVAVPSTGSIKETPSATRRAIAQRMAASFRDVPHFYLDRLADAGELTKIRETVFAAIEKQTGVHLTYTDALLKAMAMALREHPEINASWQEDVILRRQSFNVGIAVQTPTRLLVAVLRDADRLSLAEVGRKRTELVTTARAGKLTLEQMEGASCTLSNLGPFGVDHFHAILNPPESAILAAGRIAERAVAVAGTVVARPTISLSLSVDHRLIDGVVAAGFLGSIVHAIENPYLLLLP